MVTRKEIKKPKQRILTVCVQMFIEKGFKSTTMLDILREADVSSGTFQNIFRTKDGVLAELIDMMFERQFGEARKNIPLQGDPVLLYAVEVATQLAIVELNENLREVYVEAYTKKQLSEYICQKMSTEIGRIFSAFNPGWTESDFYESDIGSTGMMRAYMVRQCDKYFTLQKKIDRFLNMSLRCYNVPPEVIARTVAAVHAIDVEETAKKVMHELFAALEMTFGFRFHTNETPDGSQ